MNNATKGALLSGAVFPGLGQIALRRQKRGAILILAFLAGLLAIVVTTVQKALVIIKKIDTEGGGVDMDTINNAAAQASSSSGSLIFDFALMVIIGCWAFATADAYSIGKKMDAEDHTTGQ